ncbi:MAG: hypothetical protein AAGF30_12400 [Pseudomonadota bacterium]
MSEILGSVALLIPLLTIAGSALAYVVSMYREKSLRRQQRFDNLVSRMDDRGTIAGKLAAIYEMRQFPEHREFIVRFCESQQNNLEGGGSDDLAAEMRATLEYFLQTQVGK